MNMPSFTAEATLYKTSGQYRTSRNAINLAAQAGHPIDLALGISDEGPIEVHSCRPGLLQIGEGANMRCVDPRDPFGTGSHGGGDPAGGHGTPTDSTGGGGKPPKPKLVHGCTPDQLQSDEAAACFEKQAEDVKNNKPLHYVRCTKTKMQCCQDDRSGGTKATACTKLN